MRIPIRLSAFVLTAGIFYACSSAVEENKEMQTEVSAPVQNKPEELPALALIDIAGNTVNLTSFKGRKVFVNLWASWCPPCREEIPSIEALAAKAGNENIAFVMLALDEKFAVARQFATTNKMKLPIFYPAEKLPALFNVEGIPVTFIFNEQGQLVKQVNGSEDYNTDKYYELLTK
jgi:thiol-disulfide isomerase/thioredoxin